MPKAFSLVNRRSNQQPPVTLGKLPNVPSFFKDEMESGL